MDKRDFLKRLLMGTGAAVGLSCGWGTVAFAQKNNQLDAEGLKRVLRCKTPEEEAFVDMIFEKVDQGELPLKYVFMAYRYAVKKSRSRYYYFAAAIRKIAQAKGISLD
jgi:hypothetical protein